MEMLILQPSDDMQIKRPFDCPPTPILILIILSVLQVAASKGTKSPREIENLNSGWKFFLGETKGAEAEKFDDSGWSNIGVPHTWNAKDGQDGGNNYFRGTGWYRRHFVAPADWRGRQVYIQFDGADRRADVYLNGKLVGTHLGGFARFRFDITSYLKLGADNVIAVRVNNEINDIAPTRADFTFFGGIYRGVSLIVTNPLQIETQDYASSGVYVKEENVSPLVANVAVTVKLSNHTTRAADLVIYTLVFDAARRQIKRVRSELTLAAQSSGEITPKISLDRPHLWDGRRDPYLYDLEVRVYAGTRLQDVVDQNFGLRFFSVNPDEGFFLNGKELELRGVSRHQDRPNKGWAVSVADEREDFALIKEMGATAIRAAHYQQSQLWYDLADRNGMVVWAEIPFVGESIDTPQFFDNAKGQMRELIRQNYNRPSIIFWGIGNETRGPATDRLLGELDSLVRREDPTRISTYASDHPNTDPKNWHTEVTAFNRYYGWYSGSHADFGSWADEIHRHFPKAKIGVSEYGAGASINQHEHTVQRPNPSSHWHPEEYQAAFHEAYWESMRSRPFLWCKFIWNMFDFAADQRNEGESPGRNDKGLVTYDRKVKKDAFFWYKANWSNEPVLYITSRRFTRRTVSFTEVKVYSNARVVRLFVNGRDIGEAQSENHIFKWPAVTLRRGDNLIEVRATRRGKALRDRCVWYYSSAH